MKPLVLLAGPTAVGKTELSIQLAKAIQGEIISADSMQVYRHMDIGSAKIRPEEMEGVPHHLIDAYEPWEEFHVVEFQRAAKEAMEGIYQRGHIPIIVGGTGFYIQAFLKDVDFTQAETDESYRQELATLAKEQGSGALHAMLKEVDPVSSREIHANNTKRIIRALEYYHQMGEPISAHNQKERERKSPYQYAYFVLTRKREELYERIDRRVDQMMEQGLLEEVRKLREMGCHGKMVSMQGLGYKELLRHLEGEITLEEAIYEIKRDTRHFAKRQLTWFRREQEVIWIDRDCYEDDDAMLWDIQKILKTKEIFLGYNNRNELGGTGN